MVFIFLALICIYLAMRIIASDPTNNEFNKWMHKMSMREHNQIRDEKQASKRQFHISNSNEIESEKDFNKWLSEREQLIANMAQRNLIYHRQKRQAFGAKAKLWPRTINYEINLLERENDIRAAIKYWEDYSCLDFHEDASARQRIRISKGLENRSMLGMWKGNICVVTFKSTTSIGVMMHEIGHALGFMHSHQRKDRDKYLNVDESKIREHLKKEYIINPDSRLHSDVPYDPASIMNYGRYTDGPAENRIQVMVTKDDRYKRALGQSMHPSFCDLLLLNIFYKCENVCEKFKTECRFGGFPNPKDCTKCVCPSGFGGDSCEEPAGTCGTILEATTDLKIFAETVGNHYLPSEFVYLPPQYDQNYYRRRKRALGIWMGGNVVCHWHIRALPDHRIKMTVNSLTARCEESCDFGFAELKIRRDMRPAGIRICCQEDLDMILESETNLVVISIYGNVRLEFRYHSYGNGDSSSSSIRWSEDKSKSIRGKSIRTSQKESKSIRVQHVESIRPQKKSESIRTQAKLKSIRSRQGEIKSIRPQ